MHLQRMKKMLERPELVLVQLKRWFPWRALSQDKECAHLIMAWSSGALPRAPLASLFPGVQEQDVLLRKPSSRTIGWSLDVQELAYLLAVMKLTKAERVLEIGTYDGFTTLNLAANLPCSGTVTTLDLPQEGGQEKLRKDGISNATVPGIVGEKFTHETDGSKIRQVWGNSMTLDWSSLGGPFDLILIDGSHDYAYVKNDCQNALKNIKSGGTIFWHDYGQALGVSRAVDEFAAEHSVVVIAGTRFACLRAPQ